MRPCSLLPQPDLQEGEETAGLEGVYPQPGEGALPKEHGWDRTCGAAPSRSCDPCPHRASAGAWVSAHLCLCVLALLCSQLFSEFCFRKMNLSHSTTLLCRVCVCDRVYRTLAPEGLLNLMTAAAGCCCPASAAGSLFSPDLPVRLFPLSGTTAVCVWPDVTHSSHFIVMLPRVGHPVSCRSVVSPSV